MILHSYQKSVRNSMPHILTNIWWCLLNFRYLCMCVVVSCSNITAYFPGHNNNYFLGNDYFFGYHFLFDEVPAFAEFYCVIFLFIVGTDEFFTYFSYNSCRIYTFTFYLCFIYLKVRKTREETDRFSIHRFSKFLQESKVGQAKII